MYCHWINILFSFNNFFSQVEKTVRNGYKTTKLQLGISLKEVNDRIDILSKPFSKLLKLNESPHLIESNKIIKAITLNRQCERYLRDLVNTLADHQVYIENYLKNFRIQLNKIHEIVKFRTAIPITSIFVSKINIIYIDPHTYTHIRVHILLLCTT